MHDIIRIARKEMAAFFASPVAYLFLGAFLAVNLFIFFWVETFFARNIADVKPLFQWMPVLLIFLVAALTMRLWSEERRAGTLEMLLTLPVPPARLVFGKFLACLGLVAIALALTLPIPITVSLIGPLDWGPVVGGYVATLFLAGAYTAIGLYVSARSDNPIVALIGTVAVGAVFYLIGSDTLTSLFGYHAAELLKLVGTGSRFDSITRGVIDLRDIYYYLSLIGIFLALNVFGLEKLRWAADNRNPARHRAWQVATGLLVANFVAGNLWLQPVGWARADITQGHIYSISPATRQYLAELQEPLLIRGYFSAKTHPLLAPLVPQLRDLLKEYEVAGAGRVRVEFVDPTQDANVERQAGEKYGIKPVPFQTASKYQASVVNSYFNILVKYGDQYQTLGYRDLIDVKAQNEANIDVRLRNPEYDITRAIKKVLYAYQGGGNLFLNIRKPVTFRGFISADSRLPKPLVQLHQDLTGILDDLKAESNGKLQVAIADPDANGGALAKEIGEKYGFKPMAVGLLDPNSFYFYLLLEQDGQTVPVPLPASFAKADLKRSIEAGLKRFSAGFLKTIALYTPDSGNPYFGRAGKQFTDLEDKLRENAVVRHTDLKSGRVPDDADLLIVASPENLDEKQVFAIDQFLMQGGTVLVAASPFNEDLGGGAIAVSKQPTGLGPWLAHNGVTLGSSLVLDPQNQPFPIPVNRQLGGFVVREIRSVDYPYFPDIRSDGIDQTSGIAAGLNQVTLNWASPLTLDAKRNAGRKVVKLLQSSPDAWTSDSTDVQPNFAAYGSLGFPTGSDRGRKLLAAVVEGRFDSMFAGKPSPLLKDEAKDDKKADAKDAKKPNPTTTVSGVIDKSPDSARLIVFGSGSFLTDAALDLAAGATRTHYINPVQLVQNAVDWSLEDRGLLAIRGRSQFSRMLAPLSREKQMFWEYLNYGLALAGLALVWAAQRRKRARRLAHYRHVLNMGGV